MLGIILAAGPGRKFWPYNEVRNKCAFPIGNVPVVRRLAGQMREAGVTELVVVVGPHAGSVRAALADLPRPVVFVDQPHPEGTAAAVVRALRHAGSDAPFVVAYGDIVTTPETISRLVGAARSGEAPAAAIVQPLGGECPGDWITADLEQGALTRYEGHGREGSHRLAGLYALQPAAVRYLESNPGIMTHVPVGGMPAAEAEIAESLARMSDDGLEVAGIEPEGFLVDLDKPWHILEANDLLLQDLSRRLGGSVIAPDARVADSAEISGRVVLEPGAVIGERVVVKGDLWLGRDAAVTNGSILEGRTLIGPRARVRDYALLGEDTTLGPDTLCGHGAEFNGVLLEGVYLYHYCELYGVLGARVDIGAATVCGTLRFDDGNALHRIQGRAERPKCHANASYVGDYSRTGVNSILMPGVKVGVYSCVGAGVVLYEDLPSRELVLVKQELVRRPWGPERYGW